MCIVFASALHERPRSIAEFHSLFAYRFEVQREARKVQQKQTVPQPQSCLRGDILRGGGPPLSLWGASLPLAAGDLFPIKETRGTLRAATGARMGIKGVGCNCG